MQTNPETSSAFASASADRQFILDQISEIQDEAKKNKVQLTPEVQAYIREHIEAVQQKLANREQVTDDDMRFMQDVRLWVSMAEEDRKNFVSIDEMKKNEELLEAAKRKINLKQWLDLLHIVKAAHKDRKWIDETFTFPGNGKIETPGNLLLNGCTSLTHLPDNLQVGGDVELFNCTSLIQIPDNLKINGTLRLTYCISLTHLPDNLKINKNLSLSGSSSLISLPDNLQVEGDLRLGGCTSLTSLPANLMVGKNIYLSDDLNNHIEKDTWRLLKEGKIKGEILYE